MLRLTYTHLHLHRSIVVPEVQKAQKQQKPKNSRRLEPRPNHHPPQSVPVVQLEFITSAHTFSQSISAHVSPGPSVLTASRLPSAWPSVLTWYLNPTFLLLHNGGTCTTSAPRCLTRKCPANLHVVCRMNSLMTLSLIAFPAKCCLLLLSEQSALMISSSTRTLFT